MKFYFIRVYALQQNKPNNKMLNVMEIKYLTKVFFLN